MAVSRGARKTGPTPHPTPIPHGGPLPRRRGHAAAAPPRLARRRVAARPRPWRRRRPGAPLVPFHRKCPAPGRGERRAGPRARAHRCGGACWLRLLAADGRVLTLCVSRDVGGGGWGGRVSTVARAGAPRARRISAARSAGAAGAARGEGDAGDPRPAPGAWRAAGPCISGAAAIGRGAGGRCRRGDRCPPDAPPPSLSQQARPRQRQGVRGPHLEGLRILRV